MGKNRNLFEKTVEKDRRKADNHMETGPEIENCDEIILMQIEKSKRRDESTIAHEEKSKRSLFMADHLTVGYNGKPLISDINFDIRKGEILTLIGPNGAGKTTILKSLIRQLEPVAGLVYLDGKDMKKLTPLEIAKSLSVVLTERIQPELMTCWDVVSTGRYPYTGKFGILSEADRKIVDDAMKLVHIEELAERDFTKTSDGQKQRVMLARAICQEPDIIILDEPTSFLDVRYKLEFLTILQNMSRKMGLTVLMSLHELDLAGKVSDRIVCVKGDHIDRVGSATEVFTPGYIRELYDMKLGSYDERSGSAEMSKIQGDPEIFLICGNGSGTEYFRKCQRDQIPAAAGILWENDIDYPVAKALCQTVISLPAFSMMGEDTIQTAKAVIDTCKRVICCLDLDQAGTMADGLRELRDYAKSCGKL